MSRVLLPVLVGVALWCSAPLAEGGAISRNNPFRGYNLSGVNYGSQQWEREHRGKSATASRVKPLLRPLRSR